MCSSFGVATEAYFQGHLISVVAHLIEFGDSCI